MAVGRILLLLSLVGVAFTFVKSEQFSRNAIKISSIEFSPDSKSLVVGQNHAKEAWDSEFNLYLTDLERSFHLVDVQSLDSRQLLRQALPVERIEDAEWLRIFGQLPNYEMVTMPYSPVQFVGEGAEVAFYDFDSNSIQTLDINNSTRTTLCELGDPQDHPDRTLGWFRLSDDGVSVYLEGEELEIERYLMRDGQLDEKLPNEAPFYTNSLQLSLGPFFAYRLLPSRFPLPSPTYGVTLHPERNELAISSVLQIVVVDFAGEKQNLLLNRMKIGSVAMYFPDGEKFITLFRNEMRIILIDKLEAVALLKNDEQMVTALAIAPDNSMFATGDNAGVVRIYDGNTYQKTSSFRVRETWNFDWRVPYIAGGLWGAFALATVGTGFLRQRRRPNFGPKEVAPE